MTVALIWDHLSLVLASLFLAVAVGVPLGLLTYLCPRAGKVILWVVDLIQTIPALAQAGPVSIWMILFVTLPMLFIIYISFMSRGVFGDVVYQFSLESYQTLLDAEAKLADLQAADAVEKLIDASAR